MRIALTGGIGSGKSEVLKIVSNKGYKCFSSDELNKKLLNNSKYIKVIDENFPGVVVDSKIDKRKLSEIVFNDDEKLKLLNSLAHPAIRKMTLDLTQGDDIYFCEVPLLFECGFQDDYDKVIVVTSDINTRIERVKNRDNRPIEEIKAIIDKQVKTYQDKKIDYIINNNNDIKALEKEVDKFLYLIFN